MGGDPFEQALAERVDALALLVHDLVVFEQVLADVEVAFLDFLLGPSIRRLTILLSMASPSCMPSRVRTAETHSPANLRIRSSSSERKKRDEPGSPWRPARPRSWLSMRRLSCRSVPMMCRPADRGHLAPLDPHLRLVAADRLLPDVLGHVEPGGVQRAAVFVGHAASDRPRP